MSIFPIKATMISLKSPAKINLFLRIIKKRSDGYHELASLFQAVDLCDLMHFEEAENDQLTCSNPSLPLGEENLVAKAVRLFRQKTGIHRSFAIHLEKNIPLQGGLGGGSSNAATTLWALNFLCGNPASDRELAQWGSEIGSDISFFLSSGTAYCTGRGEIFQSLSMLTSPPLWIVKPSKGLSTAEVFRRLNPGLLPQRDPENALNLFLNENPNYFNDLEGPAFEAMPELKVLKQTLYNLGFSTVLMSGSGSSFFCIGDLEVEVLNISDLFQAKVCFLNRKPDTWY